MSRDSYELYRQSVWIPKGGLVVAGLILVYLCFRSWQTRDANRAACAAGKGMAWEHIREPILLLLMMIAVLGLSAILTQYVLFRGRFWVLDAPFILVVGWWGYLGRVVPGLNPDPWAVGTAIGCLVGLTVGSHAAFRWLWGESWPWKRTLKLVGLVVMLFVAGIVIVGLIHQTGWLIRSPEPLIDDIRRL